MSDLFKDVQRIVLAGSAWRFARHLVVSFAAGSAPLRFLEGLSQRRCWPTPAPAPKPEVQVSLGFSRRGLQRARVRPHVIRCFAAKSPAFMEGAASRAAIHVGDCGRNAPEHWNEAFDFTRLDAVLSLHASEEGSLKEAVANISELAEETTVRIVPLPDLHRLPAKEDVQLVHFGYRDGLSRIGIAGWPSRGQDDCRAMTKNAAGEFLLGHAQNSGANPWIASGRQTWPDKLRSFFHNGSFGVVQQIEQYVGEFEAFVDEAARETGLLGDDVKARLCGRTLEGVPLAGDPAANPYADFDYEKDDKGMACPFGSHVRRMNPRGSLPAQARTRPLLRRGMPYGAPWPEAPEIERGLIGHFFCASIEDQFEHLLGQWADRVPLGSQDSGGARDPLIGAHEIGDGVFDIPMKSGPTLRLRGLRPFTRTRGTAYLFYPSLTTLRRIAADKIFADSPDDTK